MCEIIRAFYNGMSILRVELYQHNLAKLWTRTRRAF